MDFACLVDGGRWVTRGMNTKTDAAIRGEILSPYPTRKMISGVRLDIHHRASRFQI